MVLKEGPVMAMNDTSIWTGLMALLVYAAKMLAVETSRNELYGLCLFVLCTWIF